MEYVFTIDDREELINSSDISGGPVSGKHLFITSNLIEAFYPLLIRKALPKEEDVWAALSAFTEKTTGLPFVDRPVTLEDLPKSIKLSLEPEGRPLPEHLLLFAEVKGITFAIMEWLGKKYGVSQSESLKNVWASLMLSGILRPDPFMFDEAFAGYCFGYRTKRATTVPALSGDTLARYHVFQGLLTACWLEVWYCVEHRIPANLCEMCGKVFKLRHHGHNKKICGSKKCIASRGRKNREARGAEYNRKAVKKAREKKRKEKEAAARMKPLWIQSSNSVQEEEALISKFGDSPINLHIATALYNWLKETLPFRCGVRLGKDRITFLVGNYRPAAIKKQGGKVRLDMVFANILPEGFKVASDVWRSVPNTIEGHALVEENLPLVTEEDKENFVKACEGMREVAPKSRKHVCNVLAVWPEGK